METDASYSSLNSRDTHTDCTVDPLGSDPGRKPTQILSHIYVYLDREFQVMVPRDVVQERRTTALGRQVTWLWDLLSPWVEKRLKVAGVGPTEIGHLKLLSAYE